MKTNRKTFLKLVAAAAASAPAGYGSQQALAATGETKEKFAERVMTDYAAGLRIALCNIGDRLGIFKAMAGTGPITVPALARRTELNVRLLREWLNAMAAARYVQYDAEARTYWLTHEHAAVLADEESSPLFLGGLFEFFVPFTSVAPKVAGAFQTGMPVGSDAFPAEVFRGQDRTFGVSFRHQLVQKWIPLVPHVQQALVSGADALDFACGTGLASIQLAKAFPHSRFAGYDPYAPAVEIAREHARKQGLADRVQYVVGDSSKLPRGQFDLVTIFNSAHHFSNPVKTLTDCRRALKPKGTCFIADFDLSLDPAQNMHLIGSIVYSVTTLMCLHDSMANGGAALGAEFGEQVVRSLAEKSGFSDFVRLPGSSPAKAFYALSA